MAEGMHATRKDDGLARCVIGIIASGNGGNVDCKWLQNKLNFRSRAELLEFLLNYPNIFSFNRERGRSGIVSFIAPVKLCPNYCSESRCYDKNCTMFHICKFYISSHTCLLKKNSCKYGHGLNSPHNSKLLRTFLLDDLPFRHLQKLFRLPMNRTGANIPRICSFSDIKACFPKHEKCTAMHFCEHYVWRRRKFGRCQCNHIHRHLNNEKIPNRSKTKEYPSPRLEEVKEMYDTIDVKRNDVDSDEDVTTDHSSLVKCTPTSQMTEVFNDMTISKHVDARRGRPSTPIQPYRPIPAPRRQQIKPIQLSCKRDILPAVKNSEGYPNHYQTLTQQPDQRQRLIPASRGAGNSTHSFCNIRSEIQHSQAGTIDISNQSTVPIACQYCSKGYRPYKNRCKNTSKDDDSSDTASQGHSDISSTSDEY